jgi:hypothetical protein
MDNFDITTMKRGMVVVVVEVDAVISRFGGERGS